jgi:hypothetical protein
LPVSGWFDIHLAFSASENALAAFDSGRPLRAAKGSTIGLRTLAEKAAQMVTEQGKRLLKWLRVAETRTLRAAFSMCFGDRELN